MNKIKFWVYQFVGLVLGMTGAVFYLAVIAILCGY
jgi:hypothetical protein